MAMAGSSLLVQKYGGYAMATVPRIQGVAEHIRQVVQAGHPLVVTVSAMGNTTDELLALAQQVHPHPPRRELDMLLTVGERTAMALLSIALDRLGVRAISLTGSQSGILTDALHGNARIRTILGQRIRDHLRDHQVVIVAGFQGVDPLTKEITTLGRGGTDLTAVALAASLGAARCELYKEVPGIMTADPKQLTQARVRKALSWKSLSTLTWAGAKVLHHRGAFLALKYRVPLQITSSEAPTSPGTMVVDHSSSLSSSGSAMPPSGSAMEAPLCEAVVHKPALMALRLSHPQPTRLLASLLPWLWQQEESPLCAHLHPAGEVVLVCKQALYPALQAALPTWQAQVCSHSPQLWGITLVGAGFRQNPEFIQALQLDFPAPLLAFELQDSHITWVVPQERGPQTLAFIHQQCLEPKA